MNTMMITMDTRMMGRGEMRAYLNELLQEQREGIRYLFAEAGRPAPSEETIDLIAKAEGMGYTYDVERDSFEMEKPEDHDFLFWNIPVAGTVDSETGQVRFGG